MIIENLYGLHPVRMAIEGGRRKMRQLLVYDNFKSEELKKLMDYAKDKDVPVQLTTKYELNRIVPDSTHQNVVLQCEPINLPETENLLVKDKLVLGVEGVTDPHNLGSLIRTCAFFSVPIVMDRHCSVLSPVVSKSSAGALELFYAKTRMYRVTSFSSLKHDRTMIASVCSPEKSNFMEALKSGDKFMLIMGNEGSGLKSNTLERCKLFANIPGSFESLNVSVATGILLSTLQNEQQNALKSVL